MKLLAIETATTTCSVALWLDGVVHEQLEPVERRQTERVLPMVDAVLGEAGVALNQLDGLAFSHGPGAFTGVRVGTSVIQGLALSTQLPAIGVSTLAACALEGARELDTNEPVLAVFDARMGEIYLGGYRRSGSGLDTLVDDCLCDPEALPEQPDIDWHGVGSGGVYAEALGRQLRLRGAWRAAIVPRARAVAELAVPRLAAGEGVTAEHAEPVYLRNRVTGGAVR
jgi:tRNA threonylcarbamoyladenosine biosynthesis protein TsaB